MFAKLSALVAGGPALNYNVEPQQLDQAWGPWAHHSGTSKEDGSPVSVFKMQAADPNDVKLVAARNGVRRLKMLRHPNVLAFKDSIETQERGMHVIYLVTEAVQPLATVLKEINLAGHQRTEYLATGILHMTNAVSFINNSCNMIHGHLCMAAVVVTETLDWRLHGFDLLSEHALTGDFALKHANWMVGSQYKPAEVAKMDWEAVKQGPPWAVDSWGLGCMMQEVFSGQPLTAVEQLRRTDVIPPALLADYQKLLSSQTVRRLNPAKVAESKYLTGHMLVEVVAFMENVAVKDSAEKDMFFKKLPALIPALPQPVAVRKVLPLLSRALEYGGAPASAVGSLMLIGRMLEGDEFIKRVVPSLSRLFASSDRNLRRNLLESVDTYGQHMTTDVIENQIYPPLSNGFTDENAYIRELTLKAVLILAPKMKQATLNQNLLKHLSRLQVDNEPSIRANTTVLLGNIAQYLGDTYCKKVLLNAFGRALKDSFPPARIAALRALSATVKHYSPDELALRALPAVAPLCIDQLAEVRSAALSCLEAFSKVLRDHDAKLQKEAAAAGTSGPAAVTTAATTSSGMLGWAMSSLAASSAALVGGSGAAAMPNSTAAPSTAAPPSAGPSRVAPAGVAGIASAAPVSVAARRSSSSNSQSGAVAAGLMSSGLGVQGDGWDSEDDFEALEDKAEIEARNRLANLSTSRSTTSSASSRPLALHATRRTSSSSSNPGSNTPPGSVPPPAAAVSNGSAGWSSLDDARDGWDSLESSISSKAPTAQPTAVAGDSNPASLTATSHRVGARPARPAGAAGGGGIGAKPVHKGSMKLGASKLGAQKIQQHESNEQW